MPVDIVATGSAPYRIYQEGVPVVLQSQPTTFHTASEAAFNVAELCKCQVTINRNAEWRVTYTPLEPIPDPEPNPEPDTPMVRLEWDHPMYYSDGTELPLAQIKEYKIKHVSSSGEAT